MNVCKRNLIWIDLEMTGLNPNQDRILEIATLITDINLNILAEGPNLFIYQKNKYLINMNKWNKLIHNGSGLVDKVKESLIDESKAELLTIKFLKKWVPCNVSPMCGSTVFHDRRFLFKYMPNLESYFFYRCIDVSTIKELIKIWYSNNLFVYNKKNKHNALFDVKESVRELLYYKKYFFKKVIQY